MAEIVITLAEAECDLDQVRALCRDYRTLLAERTAEWPAIIDTYYHLDDFEDLLTRLPVIHARPKGAIFIAQVDGQVAGCGMTHEIAPQTCEIKRVFNVPEVRGLGVAKALCRAAMDQARADGHQRMVLDTMKVLPEALALYKGLGFTSAEPFYELPEALADMVEFYEIKL